MNVQVTRWVPETEIRPHLQLYQVPLPAHGTHTVMDVLDYIYEKLDGTLSYYRHSVCNQGICGRCAVRVNGKVRLACTCRVWEESLEFGPKHENVVKDLVVR